jgi:hypothetical protein
MQTRRSVSQLGALPLPAPFSTFSERDYDRTSRYSSTSR